MQSLIKHWHGILNMKKHDLAWHKQDMIDEIEEFREANGLIHKWSELSDVSYTYTRAQWSGHKDIKFPFKKVYLYIGFIYMVPKYTIRWKFFRTLGKKFDINLMISEVRNPKKTHKLEDIAERYNLNPIEFKEQAERLKKRWLFLN